MRKIDTIVIHYSATPIGRAVTAAEIDRWHRERGWARIGYHFVVRLDGTIEHGRAIGDIGAHVSGHNRHSIGICYVGGGTGQDTRTLDQRLSITALVNALRLVLPEPIRVVGHRDLAATLCPGYDVQKEWRNA